MNIDCSKFPIRTCLAFVKHYNAPKYWRRRAYVVNGGGISC